ncbi:alpha/beta fold hydrolase [Cereibacter sphaeroides]|uniref:alpha/beta fold hydrolase n=1 Tax=Cereibacter sphaeroides TaxID=1063 RepID=UPI001F224D34|nr:alpha/beta hydrolase [Cereibacter sphaeroides]
MVRVEGRPVHVLARGSGRPVVLLHGNGSLGEEIFRSFASVPGWRWIAPDRPGYGGSAPLPLGRTDPLSLARWLGHFLDALGLEEATLVAHSLSAGAALCLAATRPRRLSGLLLIAPFCRPTPQDWKPALRLVSAPVWGAPLRPMLPPLARLARRPILRTLMKPNAVPPWLHDFPIEKALRPRAVLTAGAELRRFNRGMGAAESRLRVDLPVTVLQGLVDRTAEADWHLPWIEARAPRLRTIRLAGVGHALHHAAPDAVLEALADLARPAAGSGGRACACGGLPHKGPGSSGQEIVL